LFLFFFVVLVFVSFVPWWSLVTCLFRTPKVSILSARYLEEADAKQPIMFKLPHAYPPPSEERYSTIVFLVHQTRLNVGKSNKNSQTTEPLS